MVQRAALAVAERAGELDDPALARRQELLAGEFGRGAQIAPLARARGRDELGGEGMEMGLVARRRHQRRGLDLDEIPRREELPQRRRNAHAPQQKGPPIGVVGPRRRQDAGHRAGSSIGRSAGGQPRKSLANGRKISMVRPDIWAGPALPRPAIEEDQP